MQSQLIEFPHETTTDTIPPQDSVRTGQYSTGQHESVMCECVCYSEWPREGRT